jgi:hypothetical protein
MVTLVERPEQPDAGLNGGNRSLEEQFFQFIIFGRKVLHVSNCIYFSWIDNLTQSEDSVKYYV